MGITYLIVADVADGRADGGIAYAFGDLGTMEYLARKAIATMENGKDGTEYRVTMDEVDYVGSTAPKRSVVSVTGDADIAGYVLRKKLTAEKKARAAAEGAALGTDEGPTEE